MISYYTIIIERAGALTKPLQFCGARWNDARYRCRALRASNGIHSVVHVALCLTVAVCLLNWLVLPALGQGSISDAKQALSSKPYPWYDADNDGTRTIELGQRPDARSANRENIPLKEIQSSKKNTPNNRPALGGGGVTNFGNSVTSGISVLVWAIVIGVGFLIIGVLIWAMMRMETQELEDEVVPQRSMEESIKQLPFELDAPTGDFRQLAKAAYSAGNHREAMNYLFSHVLVTLDQTGLIRLRKGKTNRQYLNELRPHRRLASYYQRVMVPFEASFFGAHELTQADFAACWDGLDEFQSNVTQASRSSVTSQSQSSTQVVANV